MPNSWEYYQQTENGDQLIMYWICGLAGAVNKYATFPSFRLAATGFDFTNPATGRVTER